MIGLLLAWGLCYAFAIAPFDLWPLAHVALAPLSVVAIVARRTRTMILLTWLAGWVWWLAMVYWMIPLTGGGYVALAFCFGAFIPLYAMLIRLLHRRVKLPLVLLAPLAWTSVEYLWSAWFLTGFPWFPLAASQPLWLIQIADIFGAFGVSSLVAATGGMIGDFALDYWALRPAASTSPDIGIAPAAREPQTGRIGAILVFVLLISSLAYSSFRLGESPAVSPSPPSNAASPPAASGGPPMLRVGLVQTNIQQSNKDSRKPEQQEENFQTAVRLTRQAADQGARLIVWPETMAPQDLNDEAIEMFTRLGAKYPAPARWAAYRGEIQVLAARHKAWLAIGGGARTGLRIEQDEEGNGHLEHEGRFNSVYLFNPEGGLVGRYDKIHRVPFGEYIPWVPQSMRLWIMRNLTPYQRDYSLTPGAGLDGADGKFASRFIVTSAGGEAWSIVTPICIEVAMSYLPRRMIWEDGRKVVDLVVNPTNDGWYNRTTEQFQHEQLARFRCIENRIWMVRAVNTGISGVIDSSGRVVRRLTGPDGRVQDLEGVLVADVRKDDRVTVYSRIGDVWAMVCLAITAGLCFFRRSIPDKEGSS